VFNSWGAGADGVCQIEPKLYQYRAIDDCTRIKVVRLYPNHEASSSLNFLEHVIALLPFPIERLQTDRGQEFFAYEFQDRLRESGVKFRPIKPRSRHLNGKVERSQRTDLEEFYAGVDLGSADLQQSTWVTKQENTVGEMDEFSE
jgi:transposase InsO family protein